MKWLLCAVAIAGCGTDPVATLPSDAHYRVLFNPWPTMGQCLENEPDPAACAVPLALSLCESGRAVFRKNGALEVGTYAMDDADTDQHWVATVTTRRSALFFDVEIQALVGTSSSSHWDVDDAPSLDCAP
jgi:hypothetical protein